MLSAYSSNVQIYEEYSSAWLDEDQQRANFERSSFGDWVIIGERIAKQTRRLMDSKESKEQILDLFGRPHDQFIKMITNKAIFASLREASILRNNWVGHAGVVSKKTWNERLHQAEDILAPIRRMVADSFSNMPLISPKLGEFDKGVFQTNVELIMGTRSVFKKSVVNTLVPMEKGGLYLLATEQRNPVKLLPLVKMMESPKTEQNACYFYNRIEKDGVRWISYHFESESEIIKPDSEVLKALSLIQHREHN
jgi:hypothetical protein